MAEWFHLAPRGGGDGVYATRSQLAGFPEEAWERTAIGRTPPDVDTDSFEPATGKRRRCPQKAAAKRAARDLHQRVAELEARVAALEAQAGGGP